MYADEMASRQFFFHDFEGAGEQVFFIFGKNAAVIALGFDVKNVFNKNFDHRFFVPHKNTVAQNKGRFDGAFLFDFKCLILRHSTDSQFDSAL